MDLQRITIFLNEFIGFELNSIIESVGWIRDASANSYRLREQTEVKRKSNVSEYHTLINLPTLL